MTQKGKVQLSSKTDGTSETVAATEKAVKAAVDSAIQRLIPDTRGVATKPSDYRKNIAYSFKSGSMIGLPAELYVVLHGLKGWNDDSGGVTHEYASGGTTGGMYHRTGTTANDTWGPWMQIVDQGAPWQKRKLTEDNGLSINVSNGNANNLVAAGFYVGENIAHAPTTASGAWWYIEVQAMSSDSWVIQKPMIYLVQDHSECELKAMELGQHGHKTFFNLYLMLRTGTLFHLLHLLAETMATSGINTHDKGEENNAWL